MSNLLIPTISNHNQIGTIRQASHRSCDLLHLPYSILFADANHLEKYQRQIR